MSLSELQAQIVDLCFEREADPRSLGSLPDAKVWHIYREMVRRRLRGEIHFAFKRTRQALGDAKLDPLIEHHLASDPPRTRFFREVVLEFATAALPRLRELEGAPAWAADLMRFEAARWEVSDLEGPRGPAPAEFAFDRVPVLSPALRLLQVEYAVQRKASADGSYAVEAQGLCLHRATDAAPVRVWTLNPVTYDLMLCFERREQTVSDAIKEVADARAFQVDDKFLEGLCSVLADFMERGILLGSQ